MKLGDILHLVTTSETGRALGRLESYRTNSGTVIGVGDLLDIWDYLNAELPVALVTEAPKPDKPEPKLGELEALEELKPKSVVVKGWSYPKIADDLGCSPQTIFNHVEAMKKQGRTKQ